MLASNELLFILRPKGAMGRLHKGYLRRSFKGSAHLALSKCLIHFSLVPHTVTPLASRLPQSHLLALTSHIPP